MKEYNMISGGVDMSYQSTLVIQVRQIEKKHRRKNKIKRIWNL